MEKPLTMPKLGATMTEGTVLRWLYEQGAWVAKGEPLVEVMTDKVNIEVEAPVSGRLTQVLAQEGDILPIGSPLALLVDDAVDAVNGNDDGALPPTVPVASTPSAKREAAIRGIDLHAVVAAGALLPLLRNDIITFAQNRGNASQQSTDTAASTPTIQATPLAQKIAREHQLDLGVVAERKPGEKVTRADVEAHLREKAEKTHSEQSVPTIISSSPSLAVETRNGELVPLTPVRQLIAQRMSQSSGTVPHIYLDLEIDMTEAERCRLSVGRSQEARGEQPPSVTAIIVRATAAALLAHPMVNAVFEADTLEDKDAIRMRKAVHIGIATDTERALLTPVIRDAHQQSLSAIARELRRLTLAAREETLKPEEVTGATFTISNLGMYSIDTFHAIIVPGQSAILAVGKVTRRGVVIGDDETARLEIRPMMKVSLSADHRVLDGASASRFLQYLKQVLENPYLLV